MRVRARARARVRVTVTVRVTVGVTSHRRRHDLLLLRLHLVRLLPRAHALGLVEVVRPPVGRLVLCPARRARRWWQLRRLSPRNARNGRWRPRHGRSAGAAVATPQRSERHASSRASGARELTSACRLDRAAPRCRRRAVGFKEPTPATFACHRDRAAPLRCPSGCRRCRAGGLK